MDKHAKQMTEEIERATNFAREQQLQVERGNTLVGPAVRQVGGAALRVGREQYMRGVQNANRVQYAAGMPQAEMMQEGEQNGLRQDSGIELAGGMSMSHNLAGEGFQGERRETFRENESEMAAGLEGEQAKVERAAEELARDTVEIERPEWFVGEESKLQTEERLQEDREDRENEERGAVGLEARISAKSQEKVAELAMPEIEKITRQKSFSPFELERKRSDFTNALLLNAFNRRIGDRNGAA